MGSSAIDMREPDGYVSWSAEAKAEWLWSRLILATAHERTSLPPLALPFRTAPLTEAGIVLRRGELEKALTRTSDLMEPGRPKLIHARGAVARVELVPHADSPFTGLLAPGSGDGEASGGSHGLLRVSLVARVFGVAAYTPAIALKLLVDGEPWADVLAMNHTVGQGRDFNPFANSMTNDLSDTHGELRPAQRLMSVLFARISHQPRRMVSDHLVACRADGSAVERPRGPDRLVFHATDAAKNVFRDRAGVDFRLVLGDLEPETVVFHIDGVVAGKPVPVGVLRLRTAFVSSDGGDRLFFRHVHDPADHKKWRTF